MKALINQLKAARACSTPLLAITTPDQPAVARAIIEALNGDTPVVTWDRSSGLLAGNKKGVLALSEMCPKTKTPPEDLPFVSAEAAAAFRLCKELPKHTLVIAYSLNRFLHEEGPGQTIQALLNLRDLFKGDHRTFVGLSAEFQLPGDIQHDVILLDDPLPDDAAYTTIINDLHESTPGIKPATPTLIEQTVRAVRGLSAFEAEQVLAMSIASTGMKNLDHDQTWKLKVAAVNKVEGLTMTLDGPPKSELRGLDNALNILDALWDGPEPPELVVRVDEMDKSFAGAGTTGAGDNTGITQDMNQQFLVNMEDNGWLGALLFGVRGGGKTVLTQALGKAHGVPTIAMDVGAMKGGIVGTSERNIRSAFRTMRSIGGKRVLVLATCNRMDYFPAELLRRFKLGVLYFDLLTAEERDALWPVYLKKYGHKLNTPRPNDEGWTGAEIRNCCELAYMLGRTVQDVGENMIVPYTRSNPKQLESLRAQAANNYLSASYPGTYHLPVPDAVVPQSRKMQKEQ